MKTIINENQRGLLFKNGKYIKMLYVGKHIFLSNAYIVEIVNISEEFSVRGFDLSVFIKDKELMEQLSVIDVKDQTLVLHYVNGKFQNLLERGKHAYFNIFDEHEFKEIDISNTYVSEDFFKHLFNQIPGSLFYKIEVASHQKARLYFDKKYVRLLEEGTYYFWNNGTKIEADFVDTRIMQIDITGQEILTLDKVEVRINFVCKYRITDYIKIHTEIDDYEKQMHITLQLALREYIGKHRLDDILENKEQISELVLNKLKEKQAEYYIEVYEAGIKDIILPGEIRDIMNTVLIAEKQAQANVITRREEVASTRSLLNTAKLMDENATLYKLKELEHIESICENVGNITVAGGNGILSEITKIVKGT